MSSRISRAPFQLTGRYADRNRWEVLNGPGDSRPTALEIVQDEGLINAWSDKVILITGVSSGIGIETVRALLATGATIYGTARNLEKARSGLGSLLDTGRIHLLRMDQTDLSSIHAAAAELRKQTTKLNILINNAAVMNTPEERTKDDFELQFATNHLSHFLLFRLLEELLVSSSTPHFASRVVSVSSMAHRYGPCRLDNISFDGKYDGWAAYFSSKTAVIYNTNQIDRLYGSLGVHAYSVHPGAFESPNLQKHSSAETQAMMDSPVMKKYMTSLEQACATTVYGAVAGELEREGGLYLEGAARSSLCPQDVGMGEIEYGYAEHAFDEGKERELWELSERMVGIV